MFTNIKTIIFDWDGTLHESMVIYGDAFRYAYQNLVEKGYADERTFTDADISCYLGINPKDMWTSLLPQLTDHIFNEASQLVSMHMKQSIERKQAKLYPQAIEVLQYLKSKGYHLVYLSNSKTYYMEAMKEAFSLERYFDLFAVSEMYNYIPKKEILKEISPILQKPMVMIGDRDIDMETGRSNGTKTIGCLYGYGQLEEFENADLTIQSLEELYRYF